MWASFEFLMSGLLLGVVGGEIKKGGRQSSWMEPPDFFSGDGEATSTHPASPHLGEGNWGDPISPHPPLHPTISPHIDEDALEGVYFAF